MHETAALPGSLPSRRLSPAIASALGHIERNFASGVSLDDLAALAGLSVCYFVKAFRKQVGITPYRFICRCRISYAKLLLRQGVPMAQAAIDSGFFDQSHLCRHFKNACGITPGRYLRELDGLCG